MNNKTTNKATFRKVGKIQNLYRHAKTGTYYSLIKRSGKQFRRSLKTNDLQLAKNRVIAKMGGDDEAVETAMLSIKEKTASTFTVQLQLKDMQSTIAGANFQLEYPAELLKLKDKSSHAPGEIVAGNAAAIIESARTGKPLKLTDTQLNMFFVVTLDVTCSPNIR